MLSQIIQTIRLEWRPLLVADLLYKAIASLMLIPAVSFLFRLFLYVSGRDILTDTDIANFILHPIGLITIVIAGGALVTVLAMELATLMSLLLGRLHLQQSRPLAALWFACDHASLILRVATRVILRLIFIAAPFLAVGGGLYLGFLTDFDINYYLSHRPPKFLIVGGLIGLILVAMAALLLHACLNWSMAIPLALFEKVPAEQSLQASQEVMRGKRLQLLKWLGVWFGINFLINSILTACLFFLGRLLMPTETESIYLTVIVMGVIVSLWGGMNFLIQILSTISLSACLTFFYYHICRGEGFLLAEIEEPKPAWTFKLTTGRILAGIALTFALTFAVGVGAVLTVRLKDNVEVTAHRGASEKAPENTLAAFRQAIEDGADWIELDVQEAKDGRVVVAHDSDLKKVANNPIKIWEGTAAELRTVDIGSYFDPTFSEERMPLLSEVLELCRGKVRVNIELKYYGHNQNLEQKVIDLVEQYDMEENIVIMSLKESMIRKVKELRPNWTVGLLTAVAASDITRAKADFLAVSTKIATNSFIEAAHKKGKRVHVWTINDAETMSLMIGRGADNLITDRPALAKQVLAERALLSPLERLLLEFSFLFGKELPPVIEQ